jgi:phage pi2 protein 07
MVLQMKVELYGDGSHAHQPGVGQGMGCAGFCHIDIVDTERIFSDDEGRHFEADSVMASYHEEYLLSHRSICTPALPEFLVIILTLYQATGMIQTILQTWNVRAREVHIRIHSDSQNVINYIRGPPEGNFMQVPWLAVVMGLTQALLNHIGTLQWNYELIRTPRSEANMIHCNDLATKHRRRHLPNVNVDQWIEQEIDIAAVRCSHIKNMLNHDRFHFTKTGIKNTDWVYVPQNSSLPIEQLIINMNQCHQSNYNETFSHWYRRQ